jgi:PAS domain-containing protein
MKSGNKRNDDWPRLVVEGAPSAMLMTDSERGIVFVNRGTERIFGYARSQLVGRHFEFLIPESNRAAHPDVLDDLVMQLTDDGIGIDEHAAANATSPGLVGIHARAARINATFSIQRHAAGGTTATVRVPR